MWQVPNGLAALQEDSSVSTFWAGRASEVSRCQQAERYLDY